MDILVKDIRYALRSLLKRPGFAVIAVITLGIGIGANTAMFTVVNSVLLRPLPFPDSEHLVLFDGINPSKGIRESNMSVPDLTDWQQQNQSFEQIAGFVTGGVVLVTGDEPERLRRALVTSDFFPLMGVNPLKGRLFQVDTFNPVANPWWF